MSRWTCHLLVRRAPLGLAACASVGGMRTAPPTEGASWSFREPEARVHEAACESLWSQGEYVRVTVLPADSSGTTVVYLLTKRLVATNVTATSDWSGRLFPRMQEVLAGRRAIRPAPCEVKPGVRDTDRG